MDTGTTRAFKERTTILLAEDNPDDIVLIQAAFKQAGSPYRLEVVRNGAEAIQYLAGEGPYSDRTRYPQPFLLLLDLKMPVKTGFEVLEWIRKQPALDRLLVVILSGSNISADLWKADQLGTNSYLVKAGPYKQLVFFLQSLNPVGDEDSAQN